MEAEGFLSRCKWMDRRMDGWINELMDGWIVDWTDKINKMMDGWMDWTN